MVRAVLLLAIVIVALVVAPAVGATATKVTIIGTEFKFTPSTVTLRAGVPVDLTIRNRGKVDHELMLYARPSGPVDDWDEYAMANTYFQKLGEIAVTFAGQGSVAGTSVFEVAVLPGRAATISFTPTRTGTFEYGCHLPGHYDAGMKGTLTVK